ncbi:M20/M25/M40 family metallo-hydrolase [Microvirga terrae]|uniref:M20/M25/M40 family metallo-hydrolase n=1 Tax=Microvirga terrae TaxID=2740529 RepID=A0ABY5RPM4_9HYPH|nr:M20/M25/M40 family metallo-hydrolase [Microvirga terrae]UVF19205.1 M20/M25/M40 family metallo-hydrolase [Microvirga terrae]
MLVLTRSLLVLTATGIGLFLGSASAQTADEHTSEVKRIMDHASYKEAVKFIDGDYDRVIAEGIKLTEIPAPPFKEEKRAAAYAQMFKDVGLTDVEIDPEGNVLGIRKGTAGDGKFVAITAHLDTVFPEGTDVTVKREGTKLYAPGIGDDTLSLAINLGYIRALNSAKIQTKEDILFVGTVGEEGLGDLRGVRYLFTKGKYKDKIKAFFTVEGGGITSVTNGGIGSKRYRVTYKGPGGHSYSAFGLVNPAFALGEAISLFSRSFVPAKPKTTFNVGVITGGTSVNSIPFEVSMEVDMRSESDAELKRIEERLLTIVQQAADTENFARSTKEGKITVKAELIGDRPSGSTAETQPMYQFTKAALEANGYKPNYSWGSTDANMPMSLGIPALSIGAKGPDKNGRSHSLDEWADVEKGPFVKGMNTALIPLLAVTGLQ